jgi:hypothetical protein
MDPWPDPLETAQQLLVVVERQIGVQAVDDMDFGERLMSAAAQLVPGLLVRHRVRPWIAGAQARERAEQTRGHADVRGLDADVVVVVGARAVTLLALAVRQPANGEQIGRLEQAHAVGERQSLAGGEFVGDVGEAGRLKACSGK